jgi:dihydropteroate synthase
MYFDFISNKFGKELSLKYRKPTDVDVAKLCFGIINLTPDSFSDGSSYNGTIDYQLQKIKEHESLGADVVDVGAESTKPKAVQVSARQEFERLLPFLENYSSHLSLSLDTKNPEIIKKVFSQKPLSKKIKFVNDVKGMQDTAFLEECSDNCSKDIKFIAMHSKGGVPPQLAASDVPVDFYDEDGGLEKHIMSFFEKTIRSCEKFSIDRDRLIIDPGFGFGKNFIHSFEIISIIPKLKKEFGLPIFVGSSRKSFLKLWFSKIEELGFDAKSLGNKELDFLTLEFNNLLSDVEYFRMHS